MPVDSQIHTEVDYEREGKQLGLLAAPSSTNTSGWASCYLPIAVIKHGQGPTALLFGGNHGDECEGPVTLLNLARELLPEQAQGRIILVPLLNRPAVQAGTRLSPVDGRNMNRAYPGERNGTLTSMIAHYVSQALVPLADLVVDIHSGGRSSLMLPSVDIHRVPDPRQMRAMLDAALAWAAPYIFIYRDVAGEGLLPSYCEGLGKVTLGTELGSSSQFGVETLGITERGVKNVLRHAGILRDAAPVTPAPARAVQIIAAEEYEDYVMAPVSGIYQPFLEMGDAVAVGQPLGQLHSLELPFAPPTPVLARTAGMLFSRRAVPLTAQGECVAVIARPFAG
jgi:predicted deacylase